MGDTNGTLRLESAAQSVDLGLSGKLAERTGPGRMMNPDGSFNVRRTGDSLWSPINLYHTPLNVSWVTFFGLAVAAYVLTNVVFALLYFAGGAGALDGVRMDTQLHYLLDCLFFSVQTLATIGYGKITPASGWANLLVAIEALAGLLGFAFMTGLLFARFSRPVAKLVYSNRAVIAPYQNITGLMFRLANRRANELSDVSATVSLARWEVEGGQRKRKFHTLALERKSVVFPHGNG
jgi:inward rectifier potassium channel